MLKLRLLTGPRAGQQLRVSDTKPVSVGRRKGRLRLHDSRVSKNHAEIYFADGVWILRDLGSANGTYINREKAQGLIELEPGDLVQMGRVLIKVTRCDGIGMDTQPEQPDGGFEEELLGAGASPGDDPLGLDDSDMEMAYEPSNAQADDEDEDDQYDAAFFLDEDEPDTQPAPTVEAPGDEPESLDPIEVAVQGTDGNDIDDDAASFFDDVGEATDKTDGVHLKASSDDADDSADDSDAFAAPETDSRDEHEPVALENDDDAAAAVDDDLIALNDEPEHGPPNAGTTLLTTGDDDEVSPEDSQEQEQDFDDEKPALVGLHLDQAPPQQPDLSDDETGSGDEDDAEVHAPDATLDGDTQKDEADQAPAVELDLDDAPLPPLAVEDEVVEPVATEPEQEPDSAEDVEPDHAPSEPIEPAHVAEHNPEEIETEPEPQFDIDAAFDALSEGLDDSFEAPAIGEQSDADSADSSPVSEQKDEADSLTASQLDVGFIKDALSKLEDGLDAQSEPGTPPDNSPKASAQGGGAPSESSATSSPPPGLNPTSMNPPTEPHTSYHPPRSDGNGTRWFFSLLLFMVIGAVGGWFISQNYDTLIAGRLDEAQANPSNPIAPPVAPTPEEPIVAAPPPKPTPTPPKPDDSRPESTNAPDNSADSIGPDPFDAGPGVIGGDALAGITRGSDDTRDLDPTRPPSQRINPPGLIDFPSGIGPGNSADPNDTPDTTEDPIAAEPRDAAAGTPDSPEPAQAPARIVFLVDASGSLVDSLPQMLVWLNEALQTIKPDERFAVYFFKADKVIPVQPAGMLAPSRELIAQLTNEWLSPDNAPVFPSGRSNPAKALRAAIDLNPTDLYLLSDNAFAYHHGDSTAEQALELVTDTIGERDIRVHGVQFFYRDETSVLETLANQYDGTFEFVRERVVPDSDPIDLLEELGDE